MKLQLLLGSLLLAAITVNAQVSSINENFDTFTTGNTTFPQAGWSAIVAPITNAFPPVPPRMIVAADGNNRFVQAYAGNNAGGSSYLITPQIETPTGNTTLSFTTTLVSPSPGPGTLQIGVASNPADMATFIPVGNPINVATIGVIQNESVPIPATAGSYLVFKFTPSSEHVAVQIDNVVYNTSSTLGTHDNQTSKNNVLKFAVNTDNTALVFSAQKDPKNIKIFSASGQKVAEGNLNGKIFMISELQPGVYYTLTETADGKTIPSKFIKK